MENQNDNNVVGWVVGVIVIAAIGLGIYYLLPSKEIVEAPVDQGSSYYVSLIQVKHQYKDGKHVYVGTLDLPTPCYALSAEINKQSETTAEIAITTNISNPEELCAQVITPKTFRVELPSTSSQMSVTGKLNGKPVELNIFEVPANQNIDTVDIDIKG